MVDFSRLTRQSGLRIKITSGGDVLVKRLSKAHIFVHQIGQLGEVDEHQNMFGAKSNSSSDPYALNSEIGELYGIVGPNLAGARSASSAASSGHPYHQLRNPFGAVRTVHSSNQAGVTGSAQPAPSSSDGSTSSSNSVGASNGQTSSGAKVASTSTSVSIDFNQVVKIFDMAKFKTILERESLKQHPDRRKLQSQCISVICFVVDDRKLLNLPSWIIVINIIAIDLLKEKIGFIDSHDLFGSPSAQLVDPLADQHRFTPANTGDVYLTTDLTSAMGLVDGKLNGKMNPQLAASKRAFAQAAAQGAYNYTDYTVSEYNDDEANQGGEAEVLQPTDLQFKSHQRDIRSFFEDKYMSQDGADKSKSGLDGQQISASSGFNSHCSSQNNSSATSSRPNHPTKDNTKQNARAKFDLEEVAEQNESAPLAETNPGKVAQMQRHFAALNQAEQRTQPMAPANPRGKRAPKLPHRMASASDPKVSEPIPIPAPPTSAGGPSGKANLILVSPTGLSPHLPKRKGTSAKKLNETPKPTAWTSQELKGHQFSGERISDFSAIKRMDEVGKGSALLDDHDDQQAGSVDKTVASKQALLKLPKGIPAHAQLAPPATQRHILRYLMSATRNNKLSEINQGVQLLPGKVKQHRVHQPYAHSAYPVQLQNQRPLPILPGQRPLADQMHRKRAGKQEQSEESLYYCGLQARVPSARRPVAPPLPITKSAMDAILSDLRRTQQQHVAMHRLPSAPVQFGRYGYHAGGYADPQAHKYSLTNLQDPLVSSSPSIGNYQAGHYGSGFNLAPKAPIPSVTRPLMKLFKSSAVNQLPISPVNVSTNKQSSNLRSANKFMSADNLAQQSSLASGVNINNKSLLNQMGFAMASPNLLFKRSKAKKAAQTSTDA